jgi:TM2 domain-containing membrane protein YozV
MSNQPAAPAGWFPHGNGQRFWNGYAWTEHTAPPPPPQLTSGYAVQRPAGWVQTSHGMVPVLQVSPKSPALALLASFFIPGLGSMLNGEVGKGVGILVGYLVSLVLVFVVVGIFGAIAFWIWGMVDGYQGAQHWNARHGILS